MAIRFVQLDSHKSIGRLFPPEKKKKTPEKIIMFNLEPQIRVSHSFPIQTFDCQQCVEPNICTILLFLRMIQLAK